MLKVLKFGGTSIETPERIQNIGNIIKATVQNNTQITVVVSAFGGITNTLIQLADFSVAGKETKTLMEDIRQRHLHCLEELIPQKSRGIKSEVDELLNQLTGELSIISEQQRIGKQKLDSILSFGERLSSLIIAAYLNEHCIPAEALDARKVVLTDNNFGNASVHYQRTYNRIREYVADRNKLQVVTGFLGVTENGETTTLGRSGSDYTASIFGAALNADGIEIWTDVNGILTTDPQIVPQAQTIPNLTYEEAMELAHAGARVIFPPTMIPALYKKIPIWIRNTFQPDHPGSKITQDRELHNQIAVGISSLSHVSMIRLQGAGMVGLHGLIGRIFSSLAQKKINIILVSQVFSEHSICFVIDPHDLPVGIPLLEKEFDFELTNHVIDKIKVEKQLSLVAMVGEGMRHSPGISGKLFGVLGKKNINVVAIAQGSSERNISFIVEDRDVEQTLRALHQNFFQESTDCIDLYIAGVGTVGNELLHIFGKACPPWLKLKGIASSKKMLVRDSAIQYAQAKDELSVSATAYTLESFLASAHDSTHPKIFVDCTASKSLSVEYPTILQWGFSIVTANKIANTLDMAFYQKIRKTARKNNVQFYYEANVGAGLPVISTLKNLLDSGDEILSIQGVLSGTMSYLFNTVTTDMSFSTLVRSARDQGYTEPDPREDLTGMDVARKLLILARETGLALEMKDIEVESLLPKGSDKHKTVDDFLDYLAQFDEPMSTRLETVQKAGKVLRHIGSIEGGKAKVSLQEVGLKHPFYSLSGSDNIIAFRSRRYDAQPLVIKGAGAGAGVTGAGVFGDILSCCRNQNNE